MSLSPMLALPGNAAAADPDTDAGVRGKGRVGGLRAPSLTSLSRYLSVGTLALLIAVWTGALAAIATDRARTVSAAVKEVDNLARALDKHVATLFDGLDHYMQILIRNYVRHGEGLQSRLDGRPLALPPAVLNAGIIDPHGYLSDSTRPFHRIWLGDRDHYQIHHAFDGFSLVVGKPVVERISGKRAFHASRRISRPDGSFGGVLVMSLDPEYFADFYRTVDLGQHGLVALVGLDGVLRVRKSPGSFQNGFGGQDDVVSKHLAGGSSGHYLDGGALDDVRRYVGYRTMNDYPFVVQVGIAEEDVLRNFRGRRRFILLAALAASLVLLGGAWWLVRLAAAQSRSATALAESRARLHAFIRSVPDIAWMKDGEGRFVAVNGAAADWLGLKEEEIIGRADAMLLPLSLAPPFHEAAQRVLQSGETVRFEARLERVGKVQWLETIKAPVYDAQGRMCGLCGISRDITERKSAEFRLARANRRLERKTAALTVTNEDLEAYTSMVSHDLRAPVRHISGFAALLAECLPERLDDRAQNCLAKIEKATASMTKLIEDLLTFSRSRHARLSQEAVALDDLVGSVIKEAAQDLSQRAVTWRVSWLPVVQGDRALLKIALTNIIGNAVKYTATRSEASIEIGTLSCTNDTCTIYVRDNGVGFDAAQAERIFVVFERIHGRDFEGSGIGMATVKRIVERHRGRVWAEGSPGVGATFYMSLRLKT